MSRHRVPITDFCVMYRTFHFFLWLQSTDVISAWPKTSCAETNFYCLKKTIISEITYTVPKNETRVILNILYSCKSIAMKFSTQYPYDLSYETCT